MSSFIKKPCPQCPYRHDIKPFLTAERGEELAFAPQNPFNTFPCHKTTEEDEEGETYTGERSKECAGFLTLRANELGEDEVYECAEEGFKPSYELVYGDSYEMADAYEEANV